MAIEIEERTYVCARAVRARVCMCMRVKINCSWQLR